MRPRVHNQVLFLDEGFPTVSTFKVSNLRVYFGMHLETAKVGKLLATNIAHGAFVAIFLKMTPEVVCVLTPLVCFYVLHEGTEALEYLSTYRTSTAVLLTCNRRVSARQRHSTLRLLAAIFSFQNLLSLRVCLRPFALHPLLTTAVALTPN